MQGTGQWSSEQKYEDLFLYHPMPMWIFSFEERVFLDVNEATLKHYGYTREEFLSLHINDIRPPEDAVKLNELWYIQNPGITDYVGTWRHYKKTGELIYVEINSHPINYKGRMAGLVLVSDITERIRAEELKEMERLNREALINSTEDMIWSIDQSLRLISANDAFLMHVKRLLSADLKPGESVLNAPLPPEGLKQWEDRYRLALSGKSYTQEILTSDPGWAEAEWLDVKFRPIYKGNYVVGAACYARIITERKLKEEELRLSNERYDLISRATSDMVWDTNLITGVTYRNVEGWEKIFGDRAPSEKMDDMVWINRLHPDDVVKFQETMKRIEEDPHLDFVEFEARLRRNDGTYAHTLDRAYIIRDENGRPIRVSGATQDITAKKEAEERLKLAEKQKQLEITEAVISAQEKERQEIGRELHDNINQILATARLYIGVAREAESGEMSFLQKADEFLSDAITEIRNLSHALIAPTLGKTKLSEAISLVLDTVSRGRGFKVHTQYSDLQESAISDKQKLSIYRIVQEQLNNIQKYSRAKNVWVELEQRNDKLRLVIRDDGVGFDPSKTHSGVGFMNMKTRASIFKGKVKVTSAPGEGCEVKVTFPSITHRSS